VLLVLRLPEPRCKKEPLCFSKDTIAMENLEKKKTSEHKQLFDQT